MSLDWKCVCSVCDVCSYKFLCEGSITDVLEIHSFFFSFPFLMKYMLWKLKSLTDTVADIHVHNLPCFHFTLLLIVWLYLYHRKHFSRIIQTWSKKKSFKNVE